MSQYANFSIEEYYTYDMPWNTDLVTWCVNEDKCADTKSGQEPPNEDHICKTVRAVPAQKSRDKSKPRDLTRREARKQAIAARLNEMSEKLGKGNQER